MINENLISKPQPRSELVADGLLTVVEACKMLAVSRSFLYAAMDNGALSYVKLGRARRIPRRALIEYVARRLQGGEGAA
jgi:excisionase family DNA binding protein